MEQRVFPATLGVYGLLISCVEIGDVAKLLYQTHLGTVASSSPSEGLLPLRVALASVDEARVLQATKDGITATSGFRSVATSR